MRQQMAKRQVSEMAFTFAAPNGVLYDRANIKQVRSLEPFAIESLSIPDFLSGRRPLHVRLLRYPPRSRPLPGCPQARRRHRLRGEQNREILCLIRLCHHQ